MSELPQAWISANFMELFDIHGGTQPPKNTFQYEPQPGHIRLLQIRDFGDRPVPTYIRDTESLRKCTEQDILVARYGASLGRILTGLSGAYNVAIAKVDIPESVHNQFVYYLLKSELFQAPLRLLSRSAQNGFNKQDLEEIEVPLAPFNEQKRIADKLDRLLTKVDACRERCDRIPLILKRFRQSVLAAATSGELTEEWREKNSDVEVTSVLLKRIQIANVYRREIKVGQGIPDPFEIPLTWEWVRLFDICKSITDGDHQAPPKAESGVPFLTISNISKGRLDFNQIRYVPENYYKKINESRMPHLGDILYTAVGATYGIPVLVDTEEKFCFQRHIAILKPSHLINNKYLLYTLQSDFVYRQATDAVTGTAQPTVPLSGLRQIKVPLPPLEEQNKIVYQLEKLFTFADRLESRYQTARAKCDQLTPALLEKAFQGELVPQDPNDEPASVLLERIKAQQAKTEANKPKRTTAKRKAKIG